jgi:hypothetical protein
MSDGDSSVARVDETKLLVGELGLAAGRWQGCR